MNSLKRKYLADSQEDCSHRSDDTIKSESSHGSESESPSHRKPLSVQTDNCWVSPVKDSKSPDSGDRNVFEKSSVQNSFGSAYKIGYKCGRKHVGIQTMADIKIKKSFNCMECGKLYSKNQYVMDHMLTVHIKSEINYSCRVCGHGCAWRVTLLKHIKKCHPEKKSSEMIDTLYQ